jgi:putative ABC transport system permease protein
MSGYLSLAIVNTLRNRRRTALTCASIAVALCLLAVLAAGYRALGSTSDATPAEALRLMTHHKISITQPMPVSYESRICRIAGVRDAMVWQWFGGTYKDTRDPRNFFARFAVEPEKLFRIRSEILLPAEQKTAFERQRTAAIAGRKLAGRFGWKPADRITLTGDIFPVTLELTLAGIYDDPNDDETLYFNYEYLHELLRAANLSADEVGVFQVQATSPDVVTSVADAIDKEFENSPAPTETETERAWELSFISFLGDLKLFFISICGALGFTILLVSANTVSMAVRERMREVGILKTLGFTPEAIVAMLVMESIAMALAGAAAGLALAAALCSLVARSGTAYAALNLELTPGIALGGMLAAALLGFTSAIVPAWQASRRSILDALGKAE